MRSHPKAKKKIKKRPLLQNLDQAEKLFNDRLPQYRRAADLEISVQDREIVDVVEEIMDLVRN
jgi:shikimate kinase